MTTGLEYPKWIRHPGKDDVLVDSAETEAAQVAAWGSESAPKAEKVPGRNPLLSQLDHDGDGSPGGSTKPAGDIAALRTEYKQKTGKRAFPGWGADEIRARMAQAA